MKITQKSMIEKIEVLHNSVDEMWENVDKLKEEGWSSNTRISMAGFTLDTISLSEGEGVDNFKKIHPEITVHPPKKDGFFDRDPYVYFTAHEKVISSEGEMREV